MNKSNSKRCLLKWGFCDRCNKDIYYGDIIYKEPIIPNVNINYFSYNYCDKCKKENHYNEKTYVSCKTIQESFVLSKVYTLLNEIENNKKIMNKKNNE